LESRKTFDMKTRFRVQPRCFGFYNFNGESFSTAEIEEICIQTNSLSYADYRECRFLTLTVEIFNNDGLFRDLIQFLWHYQINQAEFILRIHKYLLHDKGVIAQYYNEYKNEEENDLWENSEELKTHLSNPEIIKEYIKGNRGNNELYKYRAIVVFHHMNELHDVAYAVAQELLQEKKVLDEKTQHYLDELKGISILRKKDFLEDQTFEEIFHYDFSQLTENHYKDYPFDFACPEGIRLKIYHTEPQRVIAKGGIDQYGSSLVGLARILGRVKSADLHRTVKSN